MMVEVKRRLAAILAADVAGYTKLMAADETATVAALDAARLVFREQIEGQGGRVVDMAGDSVLAVFETATGATEAALAVQKALAGRDMRFRIGVHLGEVIEKPDGTVYGDGVNLAARLEGLAAPGGVCISAAVSDQIAGKIEVAFEDLGEHEVKNVAKPMHAFAWGGGKAAVPGKGRKPTVALGRFESKGGDEAEALAAGVRDDVMTSLSNQTGLALVSDPDRADFVVAVSVQAFGQRYRANMHILDRGSGQHFGAERIDGSLDDPFEAQDALFYRIYNAVRFAIYDHEDETADPRPETEQDSETLLFKASQLMFSCDMASYLRARRLTDIVRGREPENFMALGMTALSHLAEIQAGYRPISAEDGAAALSAARQAVRLNAGSDFAHFALARAYLHCQKDFKAAHREAERSLEISPYFAWGKLVLGEVLICSGDADQGIALCAQAAEANARGLGNHWPPQYAALGELTRGHYETAVDQATRSDQRLPDITRTLLILAAAAALHGEEDSARETAERILARHPEFRIRDFGNWPFRDAEPAERLLEGLHLAGLPE